MCFRFRNYRTRTFSHPHPLHNPNIFFTFAYKENNKTRTINPSNYNNMIFKHLQGGLPTSASSVNAMCGESRHSCNSFLTNLESFFLRHCQERRRNQGLQQSRDTAIIASCKATVWKNTNRASHSCELMDTMWRSAL